MWKDLASIGHCAETGGYRRAGWTPAEREAMAWFLDECHSRNLIVDTDSIGNVVAGGIRIQVSGHRVLSPAAISTPFLTAVRSTVRSASSLH